MKNIEGKNSPTFGLILSFTGVLVGQIGLPLSIILSISDDSPLGWRIASLIISTLFIFGVFFSLLITGIDIIIDYSFPDGKFVYINIVLTTVCCSINTFISYKIVYWFNSKSEVPYIFIIFWTAAVAVFLFAVYYSNRKLKRRIAEVLGKKQKSDEYLNDILAKIETRELSYGVAFRHLEKEISEELYRIKCTNKLIFAYQKLSFEEKKKDFEAYSKDKNLLLENYPLKFYYK